MIRTIIQAKKQKNPGINLGGLQTPSISFAWVEWRSPWRRGRIIICSSRGALYNRALCRRAGEKHQSCELTPATFADRVYDSMESRQQARLTICNFARDCGRRGVTRREATIGFSSSYLGRSFHFFSSFCIRQWFSCATKLPRHSVAFSRKFSDMPDDAWQVCCKYPL